MKRKITAVVAAFALVAAACGDDDDDAAEPPEDPTEETDPEATDPEDTDPDDAPDDGELTIQEQAINEQPRDALQQGGEFRYPISSLADNWNPHHPLGNESDFSRVRGPMEYRLFWFDATGERQIDENYLLDYELDEGPPQTVTYQLNPDASWNNGDPITVEDFRALWHARSGEDEEFTVVSTEGYDQIESIEEGADENEIVITFDGIYADWDGLFISMTPAEAVADPETFNNGWGELNNDWFAGSFIVDNVDQAQQVITLVPNPDWWGDEPLLDRIQFRVISLDAQAQAFANDEIDAFDIGPDPAAYQIASGAPHADIRASLAPSWRHVTINHEAGLMQEQEVRQAIFRGLDRSEIIASDLAGIPWEADPLGNRILMATQEGYEDNAGEFDYDPDGARAVLEEAGWEEGADGVYERDGERLEVSFTQIDGVPVSENEARQVQDQLGEIGFDVSIVSTSQADWGNDLETGEFQMIAFSWLGSPFPFAGIDQIYGTGGDSNYANSEIPEVDALIPEVAGELDYDTRADIANEIDEILWEEGHTLPLYQRPDLFAVSDGFANFGAFGLIRHDWAAQYENWGWME